MRIKRQRTITGTENIRAGEYFLLDRSAERQILDLRKLGFDPVRVLGCYRYTTAHPKLEWHSHGPMIEISFLESGQQTYVVGNRDYPLVGGDVFLAFPGERHGTGNHPEGRGVMYWMLISVRSARRSLLHLPATEGRQLLERLLHAPRRSFRARPTVRQTLHRIFTMQADKTNPLRRTELRNLLIRYLLEVVASAYDPPEPVYSAHVRAAISHIETTLERSVALSELAAHVKLSLPRLKSKFKHEVGIAPADYILRRRIERATAMLVEGRQSVTDVAYALGFSSSQHFATVYKRYTGRSPSAARVSVRITRQT